MSMKVLVVDDSVEFARSAAQLVSSRTRLETGFAAAPDVACGLVEHQPIAVVVLDQKMPRMSGTELFVQLKDIRPTLRVIMLTGEAGADEVGQALQLGYHDYLPKSRISDLPERVAGQYLQQLIAESPNASGGSELIWPNRAGIRWRRQRIEIRKLSSIELSSNYVEPDSWVTVLQLNSGEERRFRYEMSYRVSLEIETKSEHALQSTLGLGARAFTEAIASVVESTRNSHSIRAQTKYELMESSERVLSLSEEDHANPNSVRARHFQQARVRRKILVTLQVRCTCCNIRSVVPVVILEDTHSLATRHQDYLNNGVVRTFDTGTIAVHSSKPS